MTIEGTRRPGWLERFRSRRAEPARVEQPIELHEHIEVEEPAASVTERRRVATEEMDDLRRDRTWHTFVADRRRRRFATAGLLTAGLTVLGAAWLANGALRGETAFFTMPVNQMALGAALVIVVGFLVAFGASRGNMAALVLGWVGGLLGALAALNEAAVVQTYSAGTQVLVALVGLVGLAALMTCTVAMTSWRGARVEDRIYTYRGRRMTRGIS